MDFSADGSESMKFTAAEVSDIQNSALALGGDGARKVVTAYVSNRERRTEGQHPELARPVQPGLPGPEIPPMRKKPCNA